MALALPRAMKRMVSSVVITALITVLLACAFGPQNPQQQKTVLRHGPYKVVISKPLPAESFKAKSIYTEHEHLTEVFNQLEIDGLTPMFTNVITERSSGGLAQDRLVVVCRRP
jgi:hypothetical protein